MKIATKHGPRAQRATAAGALALLTVVGCASVQPDARFPEVRDMVRKRLESNIVWNRDSEQDRFAREAVRRLLDMGHKAGIIPQESTVDFAA